MIGNDPFSVLTVSIETLVLQIIAVIPQLIVAIIIWYVGRYFLGVAAKLIRKLDVKSLKFDDRVVDGLARLVDFVGRVLLVLIILDYLGIGGSVVAAITQGIVFTIAIALGIAFGEALKPDAREISSTFRTWFKK